MNGFRLADFTSNVIHYFGRDIENYNTLRNIIDFQFETTRSFFKF